MTLTLMLWDFSLVDSDPLDWWIVKMKIPLSSPCIDFTIRLPFANGLNLLPCKLRPSFLLHLNWGAGFPSALHCIMPVPPLMNCCSWLVWSNLATDVNWINAMYYMCTNCSASLANVRYYMVMFYTHLLGGFVNGWEHSHSTNVNWLRFRPRTCYRGRECWFSNLLWKDFPKVFPSHQNFIDLWLGWLLVSSIKRENMLA